MPKKIISFVVDACPVAQPRHQVKGKMRWLKPPKGCKTHPVLAFKDLVRIRAREVFQGEPIAGALFVVLSFVLPRPKSMIWKTKSMHAVPAPVKPDLDNLCKGVLDALKGFVWVDDAQIVEMRMTKDYAAGGVDPYVKVVIQEF